MMKGCFVVFDHMLVEAAPWYLPLLFVTTLAWVGAWLLEPSLRPRWFLHRCYLLAPPLLALGLVAVRALAVLSLDQHHNEVRLVLGDEASMGERMQLLFTGYGALEGGVAALLLFGLLAPLLPSLRNASEDTKQFVRSRMMVHSGVWALLSMLMLFPLEAHASMQTFPDSPTVSQYPWVHLAAVVVFTLLVMMAGELLVASTHIAQNNDTRILAQRAVLKSVVAGTVAWWAIGQTAVFSQTWWARPFHDPLPTFGLLCLVYATLVVAYHSSATVTEARFHQHPHQSRTLTVTLVGSALVLGFVTWKAAHLVEVFGAGDASASTAWSLAALTMVVAGALMLLPSLGFDAVHRPESWWWRTSLLVMLCGGVLVSQSAWLLVPSLLLVGAFALHVPWLLEEATGQHRLWSTGLFGVGTVAVLAVNDVRTMLALALATLALSSFIEHVQGRQWERSQPAQTASLD